MCASEYATIAALAMAKKNAIAKLANFFTCGRLVPSTCPRIIVATWIGPFLAPMLPAQVGHIRMMSDTETSGKSCQERRVRRAA
jgi:hypothetical protein